MRESAAMTAEPVFDLRSAYVTRSGGDDWGEGGLKGEALGDSAGGW